MRQSPLRSNIPKLGVILASPGKTNALGFCIYFRKSFLGLEPIDKDFRILVAFLKRPFCLPYRRFRRFLYQQRCHINRPLNPRTQHQKCHPMNQQSLHNRWPR
jgi:hypothetical protein